MSSTEDLYFAGPKDFAAAATTLGSLLGTTIETVFDDKEKAFYLVINASELGLSSTEIGLTIERNFLAPDPDGFEEDERSAYDYHPFVAQFRLEYSAEVRNDYYTRRRAAARTLFDRVVDQLAWPAALTHDSQALIADFVPGLGVHEYPPNATAFEDTRPVWEPRVEALKKWLASHSAQNAPE